MTDNQSNAYLVSKYMTTKFPLCAVLMEVALQSFYKGFVLNASWIPRLQNIPADAITNEHYNDFSPVNQVQVDFVHLPFIQLPELLEAGQKFMVEKEAVKSSDDDSNKRPKVEPLRVRDPW